MAAPREFWVTAELYVSNAAGTGLRKPPSSKKKKDRRDSVKLSAAFADDKKVREKPSWLTLAKGPTGSGQWRSATCKLLDEGERIFLNIYVDETILYQTINIHLLNHTDIRLADSSLFFRKDCLAIYSFAGQRWSSSEKFEPVYLQFANTDTCNTWLALLRSYAVAEIYGRMLFPGEQGGSYRMWRQIEMTIVQGRNLGSQTTSAPAIDRSHLVNTPSGATSDPSPYDPDASSVDLDVSCEIHLNDILCGRTTVKKGTLGHPDWHESFLFSDLPPFDTLDIIVWREKKFGGKPAVLGTIRIQLINFRRGELCDGWFPVLQPGPMLSDLHLGEVRVKIKIDEEIILPHSEYSDLLHTIHSRNFLHWMTVFDAKLKLRTISSQLMFVAVAKNVLIEQVFELATDEVGSAPSTQSTLFRGNSILTKTMELCMTFYGKAFLEASIGNVLRRLCNEKVALEVDPLRNGKTSAKDIEHNVTLLIHWCREFWNQIYSVRAECPNEMRRLFEHIRKQVDNRVNHDAASDLPWQSVSSFCFLRFIVPAILHPHLFGLCPGLPPPNVQRSLTLVAKVIQSLANLNLNVQKENYMRGVHDYLQESRESMVDYLLVVSTPISDSYAPTANSAESADRHERLNVVNALRNRSLGMSVLARDSIPMLPHLLDIPKHLAIITSAVIRSSRGYSPVDGNTNTDESQHHPDAELEELFEKCFQVEERALQRVSQLAARIEMERKNQQANANNNNSTDAILSSINTTLPSQSSTASQSPRTAQTPSPPPFWNPEKAYPPNNILLTKAASGDPLPSSAAHRSSPSEDSALAPGSSSSRPYPPDVVRSTSMDSLAGYTRTAYVHSPSSKVDAEDSAGKRVRGLFRILKGRP